MSRTRKKKDNEALELARKIADYSLTKKAEDVVILDLRELTSMTDYFVVCSGSSDKQVKAITDAIFDGMIEEGEKPWHREGIDNAIWVLLDYVDVVVHIFLGDKRSFYNLEELWGDAPVIHVEDNSELDKEVQ